MSGDAVHTNAHGDVRRRARLATRDAAGYLAGARAVRRREAVAQVHGAVSTPAAPAPADLWLQASIVLALAGCALAAVGLLVGLVG